MLSDAMNDLQEQVKVEHVPAEKPEGGNGKPVSHFHPRNSNLKKS
jgi:hypothetical protein